MVTKMTVMMWINCPGVCIRYVYLYIICISKSDREKKKFIEKILQSLHLLFCVCSRTLRLLRNNVTCNFPTTASARQVFNARQRSSLSAETRKKKEKKKQFRPQRPTGNGLHFTTFFRPSTAFFLFLN